VHGFDYESRSCWSKVALVRLRFAMEMIQGNLNEIGLFANE
jgi:hypothetical protein